MLCPSCTKLASLKVNKTCMQCQGAVFNSISVLCDFCSNTDKKCAVCLKHIISEAQLNAKRGCNCGRK